MSLIYKVKQFIVFLFKHKKKLVLFFFATIIFIFLLFPFDDLGSYISSRIANLTNGQTNLYFEKLNFNFFPPGIEFGQVSLTLAGLSPLKAGTFVVTPSIKDLLAFKIGGSIDANQILGGSLFVSSRGGKFSDPIPTDIKLNIKEIRLADLHQLLNLAFEISGKLSADANASIDPSFQKSPTCDLNLRVDNLKIPSTSVNTPMGPLTLPDFALSKIDGNAKLADDSLHIAQMTLGDPNDELSGTLSGSLNLAFQRTPTGIQTTFRGYDFDIDLTIRESFKKKAALFLTFIDQFQKLTPQGYRYAFRVQGTQFGVPPKMSALQK